MGLLYVCVTARMQWRTCKWQIMVVRRKLYQQVRYFQTDVSLNCASVTLMGVILQADLLTRWSLCLLLHLCWSSYWTKSFYKSMTFSTILVNNVLSFHVDCTHNLKVISMWLFKINDFYTLNHTSVILYLPYTRKNKIVLCSYLQGCKVSITFKCSIGIY